MTQLSIFTGKTLPNALEHQIRSFIRIHWHDEYQFTIDGPLVPPERHPVHLAIHERHALFSHARVVWVPFDHLGVTYRLYCLGDVFTYPAFRRRGHGSAAVKAATRLILDDPLADAAILFTSDQMATFYAAHGWLAMADLHASYGHPIDPCAAEGLPMIMLISDFARAREAELTKTELRLPGWGW